MIKTAFELDKKGIQCYGNPLYFKIIVFLDRLGYGACHATHFTFCAMSAWTIHEHRPFIDFLGIFRNTWWNDLLLIFTL